ncbi:TetR family transcriptional regulator [Bacillus paramycoides]|nr:TetR family transcriptional regulator [Bacillus paramycoides]
MQTQQLEVQFKTQLFLQIIDKHIVFKFLGAAVMGILESYVLEEIDSDVEYVATQVGELMKRNI